MTQEEEIPPHVRGFLHDHIESVVQLEVLLLLVAQPTQSFSAADVGRELRIEPAWAETNLANMQARGVIAADGQGGYRYAPQTPELGAAVTGLARAYADRRVTVIGMIYSKPADPLRSFADAFKLRKDKGNG